MGQKVGIVGAHHPHLAQHLTHDQLDVLVMDVHALVAVDLLDLFHQVVLAGSDPLDLADLLGVERSLGKGGAGRDFLALPDRESGSSRNLIAGFVVRRLHHDGPAAVVGFIDTNPAPHLG